VAFFMFILNEELINFLLISLISLNLIISYK
jgi:hypothetical protein